MDDLLLRYKAISIFKTAAEKLSPLAALLSCDGDEAAEKCADIFRSVAESGCDTTGEWIATLLYADDNVFSRAVAHGERIPERLKNQVRTELATFKRLSLIKSEIYMTESNKDYFPRFGSGGMSVAYERLLAHYLTNGYGATACGNAFVYENGAFKPVDYGGVRLSDLKNYAEEKAEIVRNTENFIASLPAFHTLLYGDCGTGKTATVRAVANEYANKLKIVQISGANVAELPALRARLSGLLQKYILFVDDLSLDGDAERRAAVESMLDMPCDNMLLYVTSDSSSDKTAEKATAASAADPSLFDRFGLVVTYVTPDKNGFCDILKQILRSRGIKWHDEYTAVAELAALKKGGRSPRAAKQIADLIESAYAEKRSV